MGRLHLEVVTPEKILVSREVNVVTAPGREGEFGVLPGHTLFLSSIVPGKLRYKSEEEEVSFAVTTGFVEISNDRVSVLVDAAERADEIDMERARGALERATNRLAKERGREDIDFLRAEASLQRAVMRIKVAEKRT